MAKLSLANADRALLSDMGRFFARREKIDRRRPSGVHRPLRAGAEPVFDNLGVSPVGRLRAGGRLAQKDGVSKMVVFRRVSQTHE